MIKISEVNVEELLENAKKQTLVCAKEFCDHYCKYAAKENNVDICLAEGPCPLDSIGNFNQV